MADFKVSVLITKKGKTFRDDGYFYYLDCGDGFTDIYLCAN